MSAKSGNTLNNNTFFLAILRERSYSISCEPSLGKMLLRRLLGDRGYRNK